MTSVTVIGISSELSRALKRRAADHRRSVEAEIKATLEQTAMWPSSVRIETELAALGRKFGGIDLDTERGSEADRRSVVEGYRHAEGGRKMAGWWRRPESSDGAVVGARERADR